MVLADPAPFEVVRDPRTKSEDPARLHVKELRVEGRRYLECFKSERARKDRWAKTEVEARYDGLWVPQTDLELEPAEVALKYMGFWQWRPCSGR